MFKINYNEYFDMYEIIYCRCNNEHIQTFDAEIFLRYFFHLTHSKINNEYAKFNGTLYGSCHRIKNKQDAENFCEYLNNKYGVMIKLIK